MAKLKKKRSVFSIKNLCSVLLRMGNPSPSCGSTIEVTDIFKKHYQEIFLQRVLGRAPFLKKEQLWVVAGVLGLKGGKKKKILKRIGQHISTYSLEQLCSAITLLE
jgi:hypothetical protein